MLRAAVRHPVALMLDEEFRVDSESDAVGGGGVHRFTLCGHSQRHRFDARNGRWRSRGRRESRLIAGCAIWNAGKRRHPHPAPSDHLNCPSFGEPPVGLVGHRVQHDLSRSRRTRGAAPNIRESRVRPNHLPASTAACAPRDTSSFPDIQCVIYQ